MAARIFSLKEPPALFDELAEVITVAQAAKALSVSRTTIYNEIASGRLKCIRVGGCVRVTRKQMQDYVSENQ